MRLFSPARLLERYFLVLMYFFDPDCCVMIKNT